MSAINFNLLKKVGNTLSPLLPVLGARGFSNVARVEVSNKVVVLNARSVLDQTLYKEAGGDARQYFSGFFKKHVGEESGLLLVVKPTEISSSGRLKDTGHLEAHVVEKGDFFGESVNYTGTVEGLQGPLKKVSSELGPSDKDFPKDKLVKFDHHERNGRFIDQSEAFGSHLTHLVKMGSDEGKDKKMLFVFIPGAESICSRLNTFRYEEENKGPLVYRLIGGISEKTGEEVPSKNCTSTVLEALAPRPGEELDESSRLSEDNILAFSYRASPTAGALGVVEMLAGKEAANEIGAYFSKEGVRHNSRSHVGGMYGMKEEAAKMSLPFYQVASTSSESPAQSTDRSVPPSAS